MEVFLAKAIRKRSVVSFVIEEETEIVEPHSLGFAADGRLMLLAWDLAIPSKGWCEFSVAELNSLAETVGASQAPREGYIAKGRSIVRVLACIRT